jgi:hypothetical protein
MSGDDPVPVFFDGLDKLLQRLESRTLCAVAPVEEIRLGSLLWLVVERLEPGRRREFHPPPPTDPDVNLSVHPARAVQFSGRQ